MRSKIGLIFIYNEQWMGGTYYILNLVHVLNLLNENEKPYLVIFSNRYDFEILKNEINYPFLEFEELSENPNSRLFKYLNKLTSKIFGLKIIKRRYKKNIDAIFPFQNNNYINPINSDKRIYWIPDFQEKHFPEYYSLEHLENEKVKNGWIVENSKKLLLSGTEILFDKGIYEDIYFLAKVILKVKKVEFLDQELYVKNETIGSITNTLTRDHIFFYIKAWKSVQSLIYQNLSYLRTSSHIDKSIRGVIGQMVMKIDRSNLNDTEKEEMRLYLAKCIQEFYPKVEKHLLNSEGTLLDKHAISFVKCYNNFYG
jgi:hypothetical protein